MKIEDFSLTEFIRYVLTGFNFLMFAVGLPLIWFDPNGMSVRISDSSSLLVILLSVSVGYLFGILKVYQLTRGFHKNRTAFRAKMADALGISADEVSSYFSLTSRLWDDSSPYRLEQRRSEWVLTLHTALTLIVSVVVWIVLGVIAYSSDGPSVNLIWPVLAVLLSIWAANRLLRIAATERIKSDQDMLLIMKRNKDKIVDGWEIKPRESGSESRNGEID